MKLVLLGPYRQYEARNYFWEFFELVCDPGKLKCTFKIQYIELYVDFDEN